MLNVELQPGETLDVRYRMVGGDASIYLLTDCWTPTTCVAGSDNSWTIGGIESLTYTNTSATAQTYALILDEYFFNGTATDFWLDFDIY